MSEAAPRPSARPIASPIVWPLLVRQMHLWLGMLIAPSVLMFAFSGALQIFRLQEAHPGYAPAPIVERMGRLHKDQVFEVARKRPERAPRAAEAAPARQAESKAAARPGPTLSKQLLQWFFTLVSAGLFVSTLFGIWMGVTTGRWKVSARWLLVAGVAVPVILILL